MLYATAVWPVALWCHGSPSDMTWHWNVSATERTWQKAVKKPSFVFVCSSSLCWYQRHIVWYALFLQPVSEWGDLWSRAIAGHNSRMKKYTTDTVHFLDSEVICYWSFTYAKETNQSQFSVINTFQRSKLLHTSDFDCFPHLYSSRPSLFSSKTFLISLHRQHLLCKG